MLYVDGYAPLGDAVAAASRILIRGLIRWKYPNIESPISKKDKKSAFGIYGPEENIRFMSIYLARTMLFRERIPLTIISSQGHLIRFNPDYLPIAFKPIYGDETNSGLSWEWYRDLSITSLLKDDWQQIFTQHHLFHPSNQDRTHEIFIDWNHSLIRLPNRFWKIFNENSSSEDVAALVPLIPYNRCPIVVPETFMELFKFSFTSNSDDGNHDNCTPYQEILALNESFPELTKRQIQEKLFPRMSFRKFEIHWVQARQVRPELGLPGRRPTTTENR